MLKKEKLYDAFGELLYVVAMADGVIQAKELEILENILSSHPWAKEIKWSFDYELQHHNNIEILYKRVLEICHEVGPSEEFQYLLEILEELANANNGISPSEQRVINKFTSDLTEWFKRDLDKMSLKS